MKDQTANSAMRFILLDMIEEYRGLPRHKWASVYLRMEIVRRLIRLDGLAGAW